MEGMTSINKFWFRINNEKNDKLFLRNSGDSAEIMVEPVKKITWKFPIYHEKRCRKSGLLHLTSWTLISLHLLGV